MEKKEIAVLVPVYCSVLSEEERLSLSQCVTILSEYHLIIVKPASLNIETILFSYPMLTVESFPDQCFSSLRAYNKLVLDEFFYKRFLKYQYILIYQLDAYVFKDELLFWANKGYDYIGAPWIPLKDSYLTRIGRYKILFKRIMYVIMGSPKYKSVKYYNYQVGNGGLSLRKVRKMIEVTHFYKEKIDCYLDDDKAFYPEDIFLLLELSGNFRLYKPNFDEALKFSIEENPAWGYYYNKKELPFGCHAWYHQSYSHFWRKIIKF